MAPAVVLALLALAGLHAAQAAAPVDTTLFSPGTPASAMLPPNPAQPACLVVLGYAITNSTSNATSQAQPTAEPVPTAVYGNLTMRVASLAPAATQEWALLAGVLSDVNFTSVSGATLGPPQPGASANLTMAVLNATQPLGPLNSDSTFVNATIVAGSQDILPRTIFLQPKGQSPGQCALALDSPRNLTNPFG